MGNIPGHNQTNDVVNYGCTDENRANSSVADINQFGGRRDDRERGA